MQSGGTNIGNRWLFLDDIRSYLKDSRANPNLRAIAQGFATGPTYNLAHNKIFFREVIDGGDIALYRSQHPGSAVATDFLRIWYDYHRIHHEEFIASRSIISAQPKSEAAGYLLPIFERNYYVMAFSAIAAIVGLSMSEIAEPPTLPMTLTELRGVFSFDPLTAAKWSATVSGLLGAIDPAADLPTTAADLAFFIGILMAHQTDFPFTPNPKIEVLVTEAQTAAGEGGEVGGQPPEPDRKKFCLLYKQFIDFVIPVFLFTYDLRYARWLLTQFQEFERLEEKLGFPCGTDPRRWIKDAFRL